MATDAIVYSQHEWQFALKVEANVGTALLSTMQLANLDGPITYRPQLVQRVTQRSGTGRTFKIADKYTGKKAIIREIDVSIIADTILRTMLLSNVLTVAAGTTPTSFDAPYNYTPPELAHSDASGVTKTFTAGIISPEGGKSLVLPGCTVIKYREEADRDVDGGLYKISFTLRSGYLMAFAQTISSPAVYGTAYPSITDMTTTKTVAGISDCIIKSLALEINNPSVYLGWQGSDADPEVISRAVEDDGLNIVLEALIKYDSNTADLFATFESGSTLTNEISDNATWTGATDIGYKADYGVLTQCERSDEGASYIRTVQKLGASTSGDVIQIVDDY